MIAASRILGRPINGSESRSENLVGMAGRSQVQYGELGFTADGKIVGFRGKAIGDAGAYGGFGGGLAIGPTRNMSRGLSNSRSQFRRQPSRSPTLHRPAPFAVLVALRPPRSSSD